MPVHQRGGGTGQGFVGQIDGKGPGTPGPWFSTGGGQACKGEALPRSKSFFVKTGTEKTEKSEAASCKKKEKMILIGQVLQQKVKK